MNIKKRSTASLFLSVLKYGVLIAGAAIMILPFFDMFIGALRTPAERWRGRPCTGAHPAVWSNYRRALTELPMLRWYLNSIFVTCVITFIQLLTSSMAFRPRQVRVQRQKVVVHSVLAAQMFTFFLFLIPLFFLMRFWPLAGGNDLTGLGGRVS